MDVIRITSCDNCPFTVDRMDDGGLLECWHPRVVAARDQHPMIPADDDSGTIDGFELRMRDLGVAPVCDFKSIPENCPIAEHGPATVMISDGTILEDL